ncbi:MAG: DUF433 domain-containing protein [Caldilinea sp. CFX5]|nr:DUF433 domain-containing protein [Caldilinea sp. CFX5]
MACCLCFGGKPIIRGRRLAVEHGLGMLAAGDTIESLLDAYPWLEYEDVQACLLYAQRLVSNEHNDGFTPTDSTTVSSHLHPRPSPGSAHHPNESDTR